MDLLEDDWFSPRTPSSPVDRGNVTLVDGVPDTVVHSWHSLADKDGDGEVTGAEARDFFFRTGLPRQSLSKIWQIAITGHNGGLGLPQFVIALRLVGCAQAGMEISQHLADQARLAPSQRGPLPTPKLEGWEGGEVGGAAASSSTQSLPPPPPYASVAPMFKPTNPVPTLSAVPAAFFRRPTDPGAAPPSSASASASRIPTAAPIRLSPLQKAAGDLCCLRGLRGSLFAGPGGSGGLLQYGDAQGDIAIPQLGNRSRTEDRDAAPCAEVGVPENGQAVTAMGCDPHSGTLYSGHKDGHVVVWHFPGGNVKAAVERTVKFQAHKYGCVSALCASPGGDLLWSGSSWGSLRAWPELKSGARAFGTAGLPFNPTSLELKRVGAESAHDDTQFVALAGHAGASGQVLWTAGVYALALWDAAEGTYLGSLHEKAADGSDAPYAIRAETGLEVDPRTLRPKSMVPPEELILEKAGQPMGGYGAMGLRGLGKLAKNITKVAAGIQQNMTGNARARAAEDLTADIGPTLSNPLGVVRGLVVAADGSVWVGYRGSKTHGSGFLEVYSPTGRRKMLLKTADGVTCLQTVGARVWAGLADGSVQVWDLSMSALATFSAHEGPVKDIGVVGARAFTLGVDNCIACFDAFTPSARDAALARGIEQGIVACKAQAQLSLLAGTWNVAEKKASAQAVYTWLGCRCRGVDLVVVGFQEIEMGGSSVVLGAAKDLVASSLQERGNANAQHWAALTQQALGEGDPQAQWERVALRQMSGILLLVFCRAELAPYVGRVETCSVPCGVMGVGGNKGGVGVRLSLYRRTFAFVAAHFAAHQENVQKRNDNYSTIVRNMNFSARRQQQQQQQQQQQGAEGAVVTSRTPSTSGLGPSPPPSAAPTPPLSHHPSASDLTKDHFGDVASGFTDQFASLAIGSRFARNSPPPPASAAADAGGPAAAGEPGSFHGAKASDVAALQTVQDDSLGPVGTLNSSDVVVWVGDFNYRIDCSYEEAVECSRRGLLEPLRPLDQLYNEWRGGRVFQGLEEAPLSFIPTYKFDKGVQGICYDSSEKRRVPAWTDRIFFRGSSGGTGRREDDLVRVVCREYNCVLDVLESDHKPVFAHLALTVPYYQHDLLRSQVLAGLKQLQPAPVPAAALVTVSPPVVQLSNALKGADAASVFLENRGPHHATFRISNPPQSLLGWVRIEPEAGSIPPGSQRLLDVRATLGAGAKEDRIELTVEDEFSGVTSGAANVDVGRVSLAVSVGGASALLSQGSIMSGAGNVMSARSSFGVGSANGSPPPQGPPQIPQMADLLDLL